MGDVHATAKGSNLFGTGVDWKDSKMSHRGIGLRKKMKFGIFPRLTAGYLVVLFLLGGSNVYAILKLVQFNTLILNSYNEDIRLLDFREKASRFPILPAPI